MAVTPWYTSDSLVIAVQRKFSVPIAQELLSQQDILDFANEEMMIGQVPSILQFHEEYFVYRHDIQLHANQTRYPIPPRAIGGRLRDVFYKDDDNNLYDMTRITADDKAYFQRDAGTNNYVQKYYIEGNDIVLAPANATNPIGRLAVTYFIRPNQLVPDINAAICTNFGQQILVTNAGLNVGDSISIGPAQSAAPLPNEQWRPSQYYAQRSVFVGPITTFTAVSGTPLANQFQIGNSDIATATNLVNAINLDGTYSATNGTPSTATVLIAFFNNTTLFTTTNKTSLMISGNLGIQFGVTGVPPVITNGSLVDFLQTQPGHKMYNFDILVPPNAITGNYIFFPFNQIPQDFIVGDYICPQYQCIIPQIPTDLQISLAERTGNRIMAAIGDTAGLQASDAKLADIEKRQGTLIDNRVEGSNIKVNARHGLVSWGRMGIRRRL